ncbi:MAG: hypothetical protein AB8B65_16075 [Kordia sp.]|uniref:hypothetical protein n=1 Tax=Kordia sp. TaxID=1965332 RepID=UPI00385E4512
MKSIIIIFFTVLSQVTVAQNLEDFSKQDTLYYYFKHKKVETKRGLRVYTPPNFMNMMFSVYLKNVDKTFYFTYYKQRKGKNNTIIENPVVVKNRSFLRKNRKKIMDIHDFKKVTSQEIEDFYWKNKYKTVIYLIDRKENSKGKIFLRKVVWNSSYGIKQ